MTFDSDPAYPLTFMLVQGKGYVYFSGKGDVVLTNGESFRLGTKDTVAKHLKQIESDDPLKAQGAAQALGFLAKNTADKDVAIPSLITALSYNEFRVRWNAVEALGRLQDPRGIAPLEKAKASGSEAFRGLVEESIKKIKGDGNPGK